MNNIPIPGFKVDGGSLYAVIELPHGFKTLTVRVASTGLVTISGTAKVMGSVYFLSLAGCVVDGAIKLYLHVGGWETFTGRPVRGRANVRLEELTEVALSVIYGMSPDLSLLSTVESSSQGDAGWQLANQLAGTGGHNG